MSLREDVRKTAENLTGVGKPTNVTPRNRKAHALRFADDGETPNNPRFPLILYRSPVGFPEGADPAAVFEVLFAQNGWEDSWRDGIYDFNHFHTHTHEVLGIARGHARVRFGGSRGRELEIRAGDALILPAGTGHRRLAKSRDLLVVGAYPSGGRYDQPRPGEIDHHDAMAAIAAVGIPSCDPVYGRNGPLEKLWRESP